jgi:hypothetical protein
MTVMMHAYVQRNNISWMMQFCLNTELNGLSNILLMYLFLYGMIGPFPIKIAKQN